MKKLSKILILVLSLALVLGSIMVVSSAADVTGWNTLAMTNWDFDTAPTSAPAMSDNNGTNPGTAEITTNGYDENKYWQFTQSVVDSKTQYFNYGWEGRFIGSGAKSSWLTPVSGAASQPNSNKFLSKYPYLIYQVDVMAPTGKFGKSDIQLWYRVPREGGNNLTSTQLMIMDDANGSYITGNLANGTKIYINPYEFTNITIIFKGEIDTANKTATVNGYLYVNGEYKGTSKTLNYSGFKGNDPIEVNWDDVRFRAVNAGYTGVVAIDNQKWYSAEATYTNKAQLDAILESGADLKNNTSWAENVYTGVVPAGIPLVTVNGVRYDNPAKATEAMAEMEYVEATMMSDAVEITIPKAGKVYYETEAQYEAIKPVDGYGKEAKTDGDKKYAEIATADPVKVYYDYHWGEGCTDTHVLSMDAKVAVGENLFSGFTSSAYTIDNGLIVGYIQDGDKLVQHTGWKYFTLDTQLDEETWEDVVVGIIEGETAALDTIVTSSTEKIIYLKPVFTEVDASVIEGKLFKVVSANGIVTLYDNTTTLKAAIEAAPAGSTLVLLGDVAYDPNNSGAIGVNKQLTLDLNGHTLDARCVTKIASDNNKNKASTFNNIVDFTITSSAPGAKIFAASTRVDSSTRSGPAFIYLPANAKVAMTAAQPGYLSYYGSTPIQSYDKQIESVYVDGVNFYATITDNTGYLQITNAKTSTIKNSLFVGDHLCFIYISGRAPSGPDTRKMTATVDNCVFIGNGNIMSTSYDNLDITFTNCFLGMKLTASSVWGSCNVGKATLGAGNYISDQIAINEYVVLADGVKKYDVPSYFKTTVKTNEYKKVDGYQTQNTHADDLVIFDKAYETKYVGYIGATDLADVTVTLKEGEATLGTATIKSGMIPSGVLGTEVEIENWVNVQKSWFADYTDEAVTADTAIDNVTNAYTQAFNNAVYYQFRYSDHISAYTFIPVAPEGIEYTFAYYGTKRESNRLTEKVNIIDDVQYIALLGNWNGVLSYANGLTLNIEYTYAGQTLTYSVTASIADYANAVLANVGEKYSVEDQNYVIGLATYANAVLTYKDNANADITEIATNLDYVDRITLPEGFGETAYTATDLSAYVESISLAVGNDRARLQVTMKDAAYTLSIKDANGGILVMSQVKSGDTPTTVWKSGDYYFYQLVGDLTITVSDGTNTVVAEGYTLSNYAAAVKAVDANAYAVVCAMYEYGVAQKELRAAHAN